MLVAQIGWICRALVVLANLSIVTGNSAAQISTQAPERATALERICPTKSDWEVEAELFQYPICLETHWGRRGQELHFDPTSPGTIIGNNTVAADSVTAAASSAEPAATQSSEQEHDADSLLDSASFLSFEDWKKQNLAKVGQSADNVGGSRRSVAAGKESRRQPGINNALDSLGDDAEIELDFGGFGAETPEASPTAWGTPISSQYPDNTNKDMNREVQVQGIPQADVSRRKDAGTTCKERFNYASFDCAATVLKTNSECKGSSSVLVENKDSYMLNECRAQNKFLILELCDDILVDTVVLANYEFFSSIFHTFRVSVSDRYPAKPDQWKELGVYEARNTREVQAFAVENSLIWARYLRIEFLTHYGHEFYCPVSLIRIHGTTMMEEYKHDESHGLPEAEIEQPMETSQQIGTSEAENVQPVVEEIQPEVTKAQICLNPLTEIEAVLLGLSIERCGMDEKPPMPPKSAAASSTGQTNVQSHMNSTAIFGDIVPATNSGSSTPHKAAEDTRKSSESAKVMATTPDAPVAAVEPAQQNSTTENTGKSTPNPKEEEQQQQQQQTVPPESTRPTQPPAPNPTTQESFYKSVHKRLQMLESNSTLSLLYIEEQSRILRDAFNKVEKRQLAKTSNFLENLNVTVLSELKEFREQYDHVWKSVAFEFEHQRVRYHQEVQSLSGQLGVLAEELVFQKRVLVVQSVMVLCCFTMVLFSRGSVSNYMEFPRVQRMVARSYSLRSSSPIYESPSASPGSTRPSSCRENASHQRNLSDTSSSHGSPASPNVAYVPPTPTSDVEREMEDDKADHDHPRSPDSMPLPTLGTAQFRSQSTPPVLNGHTPDLDLDEEEESGILSSEIQAPTPTDKGPPQTS
ncbi:hypothetical protein N7532_006779 [Penicillium argentinense]|uniref:SUN domain-containing protein n=1 Tax=Penicillium argentinense TaxID=1131581 RepID=A0A9W9KB85_9EURO|nr:uncharacterized protein N7532_006779 [Penicillium argentinense]KAJ5099778.1 hypothetical protein N7532_006779 [Penicillium argentinense]